MNGSVQEPRFVLQISRPPLIAQKGFCIQNLRMGLSFLEKKTIIKSDIWLPRYLEKSPVCFIFGHQVRFLTFDIFRILTSSARTLKNTMLNESGYFRSAASMKKTTEKWIGGTVCITVQLAARLA